MAITLYNGENLNLLTLKKLITHDGNFDDFFDSTTTNANFTNNSAAGSGGIFSQVVNELILEGSQSQRVKYQNDLAYTISKFGSWPTYINFVLESRLKISDIVNIAGFSITHSDLDFTTATNLFWVGLFYDASGQGNSGLKIIDPSETTTEYTTQVLALNTEYNLVVEVYYNIEIETNNTLIHIFAWLDGVLIIDDFTIDRSSLNNYIPDGKVGMVVDLPTPGSPTELITNGAFTGSASGWTTAGGVYNNAIFHNAEGSWEYFFVAAFATHYIEQTVTNIKTNNIVSFTFWARGGASPVGTIRVIMTYTDASTSQQDFALPSATWAQQTVTNITASKVLDKIRIAFSSSTHSLFVDEVSILYGSTVVSFTYFCCNRIVNLENVEYSKSMLYKIGDFDAKVFNVHNRLLKSITDQSPINVYARNNLTLPIFVDVKRASTDPFSDPDIDVETSLILRLDFDGNSIDRSGSGFDATPIGSAITYAEINARYVASFPSANNYFSLPSIDTDFSTGFSCSLWFNLTSSVGVTKIFQLGTTDHATAPNYGIYLKIDPSGVYFPIEFYVLDSAGSSILTLATGTNASIRLNQWNHIAITYDTNNLGLVYLNGVNILFGAGSGAIPTITRTLNFIGHPTLYGVSYLHSFYMWSVAFSHEQVILLYESGFIKYTPIANDLVFKFDFNGSANDERGNFDGTLQGTAAVTYDLHGYRQTLTLDGNSDYSDLPDIDISWDRGFTIALWYLPDLASHADYEDIYTASSADGSANYSLYIYRDISTNDIIFSAADSVGASLGSITATSAVSQGIPVHIIVSVDSAGAVIIYVDNVSSGTGSLSSMPVDFPRIAHYIGGEQTAFYVDGQIWDFCLWNRILTTAERTQIFQANWFKQQWHGFNRSNFTGDEDERKKLVDNNQFNYGFIQAYHYSRLLDQRFVIQSYTTKKTSFIITDGTVGIIPLAASDLVTTNNVKTGVYLLTKKYFQRSVRQLLLELSAEEDFFVWIDEDDDVNFVGITDLVDSGRFYNSVDPNINNYNFEFLLPESYSSVEMHGYGSTSTGVHLVYKNPLSAEMSGGERIKVITDPSVTTNIEAIRVAREFFANNEGFLHGMIQIPADYSLELGHVITVTIRDESYSIKNKKFIILDIKELYFQDQMMLTLIEYGANIADYLYEQFLEANKTSNTYLDSQGTKTYAIGIDIVVGVKTTYLVEISTDGATWSTYASGKAVTTNRAIAILTACLENNTPISINTIDGNFTNGLVFKIGTGKSLPLVTDTDLVDPISANETVLPANISQTTSKGNNISSATATWDNTEANGFSVSEFGYYADRQENVLGAKSNNKYATVSKWAPYNVPTQIHARCVIPPFKKTSSNYIRCTFTVLIETSPQLKGKV